MQTDRGPGTAIVFPGMGPSEFGDVAKFMLGNASARELLTVADETLGYSLFDRYAEAEGDYNAYAQIAFVVNCLALADWAREAHDLRPDYVVGPSFGGRAAAVYSGVLTASEGVWLTAKLATLMEEYFAEHHPDLVTHSFVRVPGPRLAEVLAELDARGEWHEISCHIDHDFHMVSVRESVLDWLKETIAAGGGLSLYTMKPPMHAELFAPLRDRADAEIFAKLNFADPQIPVIADQDGTVLRTGAQVRQLLRDYFVRPVQWPSVVETLRGLGVGKLLFSGQDSLFSRVAATKSAFDLVLADPRAALRPRPRTTRA